MSKKDIYRFPAVWAYYDGGISITFPDLPGCVSHADTDEEAAVMSKEVMSLHLLGMEDDGEPVPVPSSLSDIHCEANERTVLCEVFMPAVRLAEKNRSVNRTVTLPAWLNAAALERGINFSQVLQDALKQQLSTT